MEHERCMLDTYGYKHKLRIYNTHNYRNNGFSNAPECYVIRNSLSYSHYSSQNHGDLLKAKGQIPPVRAMKAHTVAAEVYYYSSLTSVLSEFEWLPSRLIRCNPREVPQLIRIRRLSGSQS